MKINNVEKKLQANVMDDVRYTPKQITRAKYNLVIFLWGPFIAALILLVLCVNGYIG